MFFFLRSVVLVGVLAALGCGQDLAKNPGSSANNPENNLSLNNTNDSEIIEVVEGEVSLRVNETQQVLDSQYRVEISIANGLDESIPVAPGMFRLGLESGLEVISASPSSTCPSSNLLSPGAVFDCALVFDEAGSPPVRLIYVGTGEPITQALEAVPCERCEGTCVDKSTSRDHCGRCSLRAGTNEECVAGELVCNEFHVMNEGFCVPRDNRRRAMIELPVSDDSCRDVCMWELRDASGESGSCLGVLIDGICTEESEYYRRERDFPGDSNNCYSTKGQLFDSGVFQGCFVQKMYCNCVI